ncbi:MAG: hypothetical protein IKZ21_02625 [Clostridia bacterium]|nr:hypothetical protein [Clostridia bacterium]
MNHSVIFFTREESFPFVMGEFSGYPNMKVQKIGHGAGKIEAQDDHLLQTIGNAGFLFIRHIHPVDHVAATLQEAVDYAVGMAGELPTTGLSVQVVDLTREKREHALRFGILDHPAFAGHKAGAEGETVLSAAMTEDAVYMGVSKAEDNLTRRAGGVFRYAFRDETISRAEFKLTEVFDLLGLNLPEDPRAIDLGAAPGGWTQALLQRGARVTAVDPAKLDPRITANPRVTHYEGLSQDYLREHAGGRKFDILVNDMRMDARESVRVTLEALPLLGSGAPLVVTLKLPEKKSLKAARDALDLIKTEVDVIFARQLYHNRSEITVVGRKRT